MNSVEERTDHAVIGAAHVHQQVVENPIIDYIAIPLHQGVIMGYIAQFSAPPRRVTISYSRL